MKAHFCSTFTVDSIDHNIRLSKFLTQKGICSRREADHWITQRWIQVEGINATLGQRLQKKQNIYISTKAHAQQAKNLTFLLHKPIGYVSGQPENNYRSASTLLTLKNQYHTPHQQIYLNTINKYCFAGLAPAGRLDIDSTGLLVLTQDGRLAKHLIGHNSEIEKEYLVRVHIIHQNRNGAQLSNFINQLQHGLVLDGVHLRPAKVYLENPQKLRIILKEGRKRQIRRMCELVGLKVIALKRIRIGNIYLNDLPPGKWRLLEPHESF